MLRDMIRGDVLKEVRAQRLEVSEDQVEVSRTSDARFGDYSSNVALKLGTEGQGDKVVKDIEGGSSRQARTISKDNKQSPLETAKKLADSLKDLPYIEKLEVAGPGFLNFWIKAEVLQEEVERVLVSPSVILSPKDEESKKRSFASAQDDKKGSRKIIVEFTDPNPFKEFHIGHLYSNIVGESICRLLEATGANVWRVNYQGDVGMHVAKAIWGIPKALEKEHEKFEYQKLKPLKTRAFFLGMAYHLGAKAFEEDEIAKGEIIELNKKIYQNRNQIKEYVEGRNWSLDYFEEIYKRLGMRESKVNPGKVFDHYYFESEVAEKGIGIVNKNKGKVFEESEGAIIFPGEKYDLHNRVFINSLGLPTYEAKELGLAPTKYEDFPYDESLIVTGNEINDYFRVLLKAIEIIFPDLGSKTKHIGHGMVRFPGGKISSRLGNVLLGVQILNESVKRVKENFKDASETVAESVGLGAVKYALLKGSIGQDVNYSMDDWINLNGNSGPYLQYTYARCRSVIAKVKSQKSKVKSPDLSEMDAEEEAVLRALGHFEEVVLDAANTYSPNLVANFLFEVAQKYNSFYNKLPILKAEEKERERRLFLTEATADILKKGLYLLGIEAPEKM